MANRGLYSPFGKYQFSELVKRKSQTIPNTSTSSTPALISLPGLYDSNSTNGRNSINGRNSTNGRNSINGRNSSSIPPLISLPGDESRSQSAVPQSQSQYTAPVPVPQSQSQYVPVPVPHSNVPTPAQSATQQTKFQSFLRALSMDIQTYSTDDPIYQILFDYREAIIKEENARENKTDIIEELKLPFTERIELPYLAEDKHVIPGITGNSIERIAELTKDEDEEDKNADEQAAEYISKIFNYPLATLNALQPFVYIPPEYRQHLVVAGGYVFNLINGKISTNPLTDIDIFVFGTDKVAELIINVINHFITHPGKTRVTKIVISPHAISVFIGQRIPTIRIEHGSYDDTIEYNYKKLQYQFILREYDSLQQIFTGCDLDPSRAGLTYTGEAFDLHKVTPGTKLNEARNEFMRDNDKFNWYITPTVREVLKSQMFIPGPIFSETYEYRIAKYINRNLSAYIVQSSTNTSIEARESAYGYSRLLYELRQLGSGKLLSDYINSDYMNAELKNQSVSRLSNFDPDEYEFDSDEYELYDITIPGTNIFILSITLYEWTGFKSTVFSYNIKNNNKNETKSIDLNKLVEKLNPNGQGSFHPRTNIKQWSEWINK